MYTHNELGCFLVLVLVLVFVLAYSINYWEWCFSIFKYNLKYIHFFLKLRQILLYRFLWLLLSAHTFLLACLKLTLFYYIMSFIFADIHHLEVDFSINIATLAFPYAEWLHVTSLSILWFRVCLSPSKVYHLFLKACEWVFILFQSDHLRLLCDYFPYTHLTLLLTWLV